MFGKCKMTGNEKMFPCSAAGCPLFGDCLVEYEKEHKKNTAKPQTNADRIRAMSDEELADLFCEAYNAGCDDATAWEYGSHQNTFIWDEKWLKQPVEVSRGEEI